jgi:hypothetical protein
MEKHLPNIWSFKTFKVHKAIFEIYISDMWLYTTSKTSAKAFKQGEGALYFASYGKLGKKMFVLRWIQTMVDVILFHIDYLV